MNKVPRPVRAPAGRRVHARAATSAALHSSPDPRAGRCSLPEAYQLYIQRRA